MEKVISYIYAVGSGEDLRLGNYTKLRCDKTHEELEEELFRDNTFREYPQLLGVYQFDSIDEDIQTDEGLKYLKNYNEYQRSVELHSIFQRTGVMDMVNPDLIFIAFNPDQITESKVRKSIGDRLKRVAVAPLIELPNFKNKKHLMGQDLFEKGNYEYGENNDWEKTVNLLRPLVGKYETELECYGGTREDFDYLQCFRDALEHTRRITFFVR